MIFDEILVLIFFSNFKLIPGLGDVQGQTTSPWAGPVHGKNQPMARPTRCSFTLKRIGFVHRVYDSCTNVADESIACQNNL